VLIISYQRKSLSETSTIKGRLSDLIVVTSVLSSRGAFVFTIINAFDANHFNSVQNTPTSHR